MVLTSGNCFALFLWTCSKGNQGIIGAKVYFSQSHNCSSLSSLREKEQRYVQKIPSRSEGNSWVWKKSLKFLLKPYNVLWGYLLRHTPRCVRKSLLHAFVLLKSHFKNSVLVLCLQFSSNHNASVVCSLRHI